MSSGSGGKGGEGEGEGEVSYKTSPSSLFCSLESTEVGTP